nr:sigma factor [Bifidobacterium ramosum]
MTSPGGEVTRDEDLLARVASGDERAFESLYGRYAVAVLAFVRARVSDAGTAEEVCADVWLGCWRSARAFRGDAKVLSWLLGIAKRQITMRVRRGRPDVTALDDAPEPRDDGPSPETVVLSEAGVDDLTALLRRLPVELVETATTMRRSRSPTPARTSPGSIRRNCSPRSTAARTAESATAAAHPTTDSACPSATRSSDSTTAP